MKKESDIHQQFLEMAIQLARENVMNGGGPFGAVIVKNGEVVATGVNRVTDQNDPTAHAEVVAIRAASQKLNDFELTNCVLYSSCEPCPMCLGASYWARVQAIYFASNREDAQEAGFSDATIYSELNKPLHQRSLPTENIKPKMAGTEFSAWQKQANKQQY